MSLLSDFPEYSSKLQNNQYIASTFATFAESNIGRKITLNPSPPDSTKNDDLIEHDYLDILGSTTNILIYCLLDNSPGQEFTRVSIRQSIEKHIDALEKNKEIDPQHITRIQKGKAAVNYWIDRMVENGTFDKKHTKPVKFWIKKRSNYQRNVINHRIPIQTRNNLRGLF